jgi:pimeloyl-ACP methyl ester carboxylesterase
MAKSTPLTLVQGATALLGGAIGGWILYSRFGINHEVPLEPAIDTPIERITGKLSGASLSFYVSRPEERSMPPLLLIHSINAAASAYEMRPIFETYRGQRDVYALDLPGFGFSKRPDIEYTPELFKQAIVDLLEQIGEPADVVALSLSCEFAASAAHQRPELFRSLTMLSPSGFNRRDNKRASQNAQQSGTSDFFYNLFSFPLWGRAFYDLIATRKSIHYFLQQSFEGSVDANLDAYAYQTSHQPGAERAPLYFVSGKLFNANILETVYSKLTIPVLVLYDFDSFVSFDRLPDLVEKHENWHAVRIVPTRGLAQFEKMTEVALQLDQFWAKAGIETSH